ncbi:SDR family oxidoreductase [Georgenia deserti]|uniref:SDR family oxidoreductase n=1 Tax=Georgenia deserti TaxID=2093781 RepID=A0ABW4KZT5_9MICO
MTERILVTGGTGQLGRRVVERLTASGLTVRVMSRRPRTEGSSTEWATADLRSGAGLRAAVDGVDVVIHLAFAMRDEPDATGRLAEAALDAGVRHFIYIAIVGADRIPMGFMKVQVATEERIVASGLPVTLVRATQFHDLVRSMLATLAKSPVMFVPDVCVQAIDAGEVADRLVELALGKPAGRVADVGGPEVHRLTELARSYLRATGRRRPVVGFRIPGRAFRIYRDGANLTPGNAYGSITFEEYLARHPAARKTSYHIPV